MLKNEKAEVLNIIKMEKINSKKFGKFTELSKNQTRFILGGKTETHREKCTYTSGTTGWIVEDVNIYYDDNSVIQQITNTYPPSK